jgi:ketosteroid isomerase-like protein
MVPRNVEMVQALIDALNDRDVERYLACCTEDVELRPATGPIEGVYAGREGIRRFFADIGDSAPDFRLEAERIEVVSPDRLIAFTRLTATGRASGVPADQAVATVYDLRDGRMRRIRVFLDRQEAVQAARST